MNRTPRNMPMGRRRFLRVRQPQRALRRGPIRPGLRHGKVEEANSRSGNHPVKPFVSISTGAITRRGAGTIPQGRTAEHVVGIKI